MNSLLPFMKDVGVGKSGSRNLDRETADQAMTALLEGNFHPVTFGAFFMGLRYKGESYEELSGFLDAANRTIATAIKPPPAGLLNCAGAYDGKSRTCNVTIPTALTAAAAGVPIALHGARNIPTKCGMTSGHILEELGLDTSRPLDLVADDLHSVGIGYAEQSVFHGKLHALLPLRQQMGKRTILNTMETLANPFGASCHLGGFFHDPYAELVIQAMQTGCTGFRRAMMVKGIEGSDELRPGRMFIARYIDGAYSKEPIDSDELGLSTHISELSAPTDTVENRVDFSVRRILDLLDSPCQASGFRNSVILNAGIRIYASGRTSDIREAIDIATEALNSGAAGDMLQRWKKQHSDCHV